MDTIIESTVKYKENDRIVKFFLKCINYFSKAEVQNNETDDDIHELTPAEKKITRKALAERGTGKKYTLEEFKNSWHI
ncbi:MAG: hypothetical protein LBR36_04240 [Bacteroidales bacterium]|jgi:hypothetical protein|nr:hypothetical protein [Bacteroidales bacterium]